MKETIWSTRKRGVLFPTPKPTPSMVAAAVKNARQVLAFDLTPTVLILRRDLEILIEAAQAAKETTT